MITCNRNDLRNASKGKSTHIAQLFWLIKLIVVEVIEGLVQD